MLHVEHVADLHIDDAFFFVCFFGEEAGELFFFFLLFDYCRCVDVSN